MIYGFPHEMSMGARLRQTLEGVEAEDLVPSTELDGFAAERIEGAAHPDTKHPMT